MMEKFPGNVYGEFMNICEEGCTKCTPSLTAYEDGEGNTVYVLSCEHAAACWYAFNKGLEAEK